MSRSYKKYKVRDRRNRYERVESSELEDKFFTGKAKSHDRQIRKRGLEEPDDINN